MTATTGRWEESDTIQLVDLWLWGEKLCKTFAQCTATNCRHMDMFLPIFVFFEMFDLWKFLFLLKYPFLSIHFTMQLGNLNTDSRNSMQNQELSFIWSPFNLIHLKYCALDKGFERINTQILCRCHKKNCVLSLRYFFTSKNGYLRNKKYPKCIFGAFAHLGHF